MSSARSFTLEANLQMNNSKQFTWPHSPYVFFFLMSADLDHHVEREAVRGVYHVTDAAVQIPEIATNFIPIECSRNTYIKNKHTKFGLDRTHFILFRCHYFMAPDEYFTNKCYYYFFYIILVILEIRRKHTSI